MGELHLKAWRKRQEIFEMNEQQCQKAFELGKNDHAIDAFEHYVEIIFNKLQVIRLSGRRLRILHDPRLTEELEPSATRRPVRVRAGFVFVIFPATEGRQGAGARQLR
jgi:calcineurin-like phosphoesterase family protein